MVLLGSNPTGGALATIRVLSGTCGTQTAGLAFGGSPATAATEEYNGTTWTAGGSLNTARDSLAGAGIQTAALGFGGSPNATEEYDGTSWTNTTSLSTARYS
jgi:hypothetical protein